MQILAKLVVATTILFSTCFVNPETKKIEAAGIEVVGISDGDTLTVLYRNEKRQQKIRLATIDAPEYSQAYGTKSRQHLSDLVFRKQVTIRKISDDRYGRVVAEVFLDGKNINVEQIKSGNAWHYKHHEKQQTPKERLIYSAAEEFARENKLGIWQDKNPMPPWDYRKHNPRNGSKK